MSASTGRPSCVTRRECQLYIVVRFWENKRTNVSQMWLDRRFTPGRPSLTVRNVSTFVCFGLRCRLAANTWRLPVVALRTLPCAWLRQLHGVFAAPSVDSSENGNVRAQARTSDDCSDGRFSARKLLTKTYRRRQRRRRCDAQHRNQATAVDFCRSLRGWNLARRWGRRKRRSTINLFLSPSCACFQIHFPLCERSADMPYDISYAVAIFSSLQFFVGRRV
jgi:hypothetical protein